MTLAGNELFQFPSEEGSSEEVEEAVDAGVDDDAHLGDAKRNAHPGPQLELQLKCKPTF